MRIATCTEIRRIEADAIAHGIDAWELMEEAASQIADAVMDDCPERGLCIVYAGKGNNGGDALAVARILALNGWKIWVRSLTRPRDFHGLLLKEWQDLSAVTGERVRMESLPSVFPRGRVIVLDGILGSGASGELRSDVALLCREINSLRRLSGQTRVWAIDIPTGVNADTGEPVTDAVRADCTAAVACVKPGLLKNVSAEHIGRLVCIPLASLHLNDGTGDTVMDADMLSPLLSPRPCTLYKNKAGRVDIIAGSPGMIGAARLCAASALKSGAGLVVLYALPNIYPLLATSCLPEIMVKPINSYAEIAPKEAQTLLIGPGLGVLPRTERNALQKLAEGFRGSLVLDADGLNTAAADCWSFSANTILTPHPGEMRRLFPQAARLSRRETAEQFTARCAAALVLKGSRTIVAQNGHSIRYNSTGSSAMATAGEGDVLAGVCAGLTAQGISPYNAASLAVFACGLASDLACRHTDERNLTAGDTLAYLGTAFRKIAYRQY